MLLFFIGEVTAMKLEDLFDGEIQTLKRKMEVGDYTHSIFQDSELKAIKEEAGVEADYPYIVQVNTYAYYVGDHLYESKVDVDSNKVLETKHIDFKND